MLALKYLIAQCFIDRESPEVVLQVTPAQKTPTAFSKILHKGNMRDAFATALERMPSVIERLIELNGFASAKLVTQLYKAKKPDSELPSFEEITEFLKSPATVVPGFSKISGIEGAALLASLWYEGVSLTWALFGFGSPVWRQPYENAVLHPDIKYNQYIRTVRETQAIEQFTRNWWIGGANVIGPTHFSIVRLLSLLPKIPVFPDMPDFNTMYKWVREMISRTDLPAAAEPILHEVMARLREAPSETPILFFATNAMAHRWMNGTKPRIVTQRYFLLIKRMFDMYKPEEALHIWLSNLNEIAKVLKWKDLLAVVKKKTWQNPNGPDIYQDASMSPEEKAAFREARKQEEQMWAASEERKARKPRTPKQKVMEQPVLETGPVLETQSDTETRSVTETQSVAGTQSTAVIHNFSEEDEYEITRTRSSQFTMTESESLKVTKKKRKTAPMRKDGARHKGLFHDTIQQAGPVLDAQALAGKPKELAPSASDSSETVIIQEAPKAPEIKVRRHGQRKEREKKDQPSQTPSGQGE